MAFFNKCSWPFSPFIRALEDTFATIDEDTDTIRISFFEILNEKIYDLLKNARGKVPLGLRQEGHRFLVGDLSAPTVASVEEAELESYLDLFLDVAKTSQFFCILCLNGKFSI